MSSFTLRRSSSRAILPSAASTSLLVLLVYRSSCGNSAAQDADQRYSAMPQIVLATSLFSTEFVGYRRPATRLWVSAAHAAAARLCPASAAEEQRRRRTGRMLRVHHRCLRAYQPFYPVYDKTPPEMADPAFRLVLSFCAHFASCISALITTL